MRFQGEGIWDPQDEFSQFSAVASQKKDPSPRPLRETAPESRRIFVAGEQQRLAWCSWTSVWGKKKQLKNVIPFSIAGGGGSWAGRDGGVRGWGDVNAQGTCGVRAAVRRPLGPSNPPPALVLPPDSLVPTQP